MSSNKIKSFNQNRDLCFWSMIWGWIPSVWRAVLSLFYPPVIIWGKNGKNSENPVGSNKSEKRKPKSAVYRRILASVVYFHLRIISAKNHKRKMTRKVVFLTEPWVRIPLSPPECSVCKRFLPFAGFFFFLHLWDFSVSSLLKIGSSLLNFLRFELWICSWRILSKAIRRRSYEITSNAPLRPFTIASADDSLEL